MSTVKAPVRIAVSGAAGQISYALLFRLIAGDLVGRDQPVTLSLLEVPQIIGNLQGVVMELADCAAPLLQGVTCHSSPESAFEGADLVFLVGAHPRGPGMERRDLLEVNAQIFAEQGRALNTSAKRSVRVLVVGNPANTNALIASSNAPDLPMENFSAMTRLDHNRAISLLASHSGHNPSDVDGVIIWGNHSTMQYPDLHHARVQGRPALECVDSEWYEHEFIPAIQNRGAEVIRIRGKSSAASGANAAVEHMRDWVLGTPPDRWTSMSVCTDGRYGLAPGIFFSSPVRTAAGHWTLVEGLDIDEFSHARMKASEAELLLERDMVRHLLP